MSLETVVQFNYKWVVQHRHYRLLVLNYVLLLVLADESFQHHLHRVELPVSETSHQVNLAKTTDCETLADLVLL